MISSKSTLRLNIALLVYIVRYTSTYNHVNIQDITDKTSLLFVIVNVYSIRVIHLMATHSNYGSTRDALGIGPTPLSSDDNDDQAPLDEHKIQLLRRRRQEVVEVVVDEEQRAVNSDISPDNKPAGWYNYGYYRTRHYFQCSDNDITKPLPTKVQYLGKNIANVDDTISPTEGYNIGDEEHSKLPPYYAEFKNGRRGLYASRDIKQGELVNNDNKGAVQFPSSHSWRMLVFNLTTKELACEVINSSWVQRRRGYKPYHLFSSANISKLMNIGTEKTITVNREDEYSPKMVAMRDIKKGEEILRDVYEERAYAYAYYRDEYDTVWDYVGLGEEEGISFKEYIKEESMEEVKGKEGVFIAFAIEILNEIFLFGCQLFLVYKLLQWLGLGVDEKSSE